MKTSTLVDDKQCEELHDVCNSPPHTPRYSSHLQELPACIVWTVELSPYQILARQSEERNATTNTEIK